jgi:hypothetical protein
VQSVEVVKCGDGGEEGDAAREVVVTVGRVRRVCGGGVGRADWRVVFQKRVVADAPLTQGGGPCRIPQRVLCGGRVPPGPAATFHGILRKRVVGRLAWCLRVPTGSLPRTFTPSTDVIVGNVSGGGGCPGGCDSLLRKLGKTEV